MIIPRELIINSDACDGGRCVLLRKDCHKATALDWADYKEGEHMCPCETCEYFIKFKESGMTLAEFRSYIYHNWYEITVESRFP